LETNDLIKGLKRGKRAAYEALYDQYAGLFVTICMRYASNSQEAEDLTQEAILKIIQNIDSFKNNGSFEGWMKRIVINTCLNEYRKHSLPLSAMDDMKEDELNEMASDFANGLDQLSAQELFAMITALPHGYRTIFNRVVMEGYSHKEVAETLKITESASRSQLTKAKLKLREKIIEANSYIYEQTGS
jgi:RNA polymerase sigma factor (sigma-70 family)